MITWYTQPAGAFASFYYYDDESRELVRIRLALNRPRVEGRDAGVTGAFYHSNHYVGFSKTIYDSAPRGKFTLDSAGTIVDDCGVKLGKNPKPGLAVYDFSSHDRIRPDKISVHKGDVVIHLDDARLPKGITETDLEAVAIICLGWKAKIKFTNRHATEKELVRVIKIMARGTSH